MSYPDPNAPPDRTPIQIGEVWENPISRSAPRLLIFPTRTPRAAAACGERSRSGVQGAFAWDAASTRHSFRSAGWFRFGVISSGRSSPLRPKPAHFSPYYLQKASPKTRKLVFELSSTGIEEAVNQEWPEMAQQQKTLRDLPIALIEALTLALTPNSENQKVALHEIVAALEKALDARRTHHPQSIYDYANQMVSPIATGALHFDRHFHGPQ